jgi:hypothetical protein
MASRGSLLGVSAISGLEHCNLIKLRAQTRRGCTSGQKFRRCTPLRALFASPASPLLCGPRAYVVCSCRMGMGTSKRRSPLLP